MSMDFIEILQDYNRAVSAKDSVKQEALSAVISEAKRMAARRGPKSSVTEEQALEAIRCEIAKMERQMALAGPSHHELQEKYRLKKTILEEYQERF